MAEGMFSLHFGGYEELVEAMIEYPKKAEKAFDDVLHGEGFEEIKDEITMLLPVSGRRFKGKKAPAKAAQPFIGINGMLSVTVTARGHYNYLYFPDDGSNTVHHAGQQHFMRRGAENASDKIVELCLGRLQEL